MAKQRTPKTAPADTIPRWQVRVEYVETCNCAFACPCNFSGYPTDGYCEALVGYHIRDGRFGPYVTDGETNASLRRGDTPDAITLERAVELLAERRAKSE